MSMPTLSWHGTYGAWRATGQEHDYLVTQFKTAWAAFFRPHTTEVGEPYAMLPFSSYRSRREAQRIAESHEVNCLAKS